MAAGRLSYGVLIAFALALWALVDASAWARHYGQRHARSHAPRHKALDANKYVGVPLTVDQVPRHLRALYAPYPRYLDKDKYEALNRTLCRYGAPRRECARARRSGDTDRLVEALLNPPSARTRPAIQFFGLPEVEGVPPAAILAKPAPGAGVPLPIYQQFIRDAGR